MTEPLSHQQARREAAAARAALHTVAAADLPGHLADLADLGDIPPSMWINGTRPHLDDIARHALTTYAFASDGVSPQARFGVLPVLDRLIPHALYALHLLSETTPTTYSEIIEHAENLYHWLTPGEPDEDGDEQPGDETEDDGDDIEDVLADPGGPQTNTLYPVTIARDAAIYVAAMQDLAVQTRRNWPRLLASAADQHQRQAARELAESGGANTCRNCGWLHDGPHRWYQLCGIGTCHRRP